MGREGLLERLIDFDRVVLRSSERSSGQDHEAPVRLTIEEKKVVADVLEGWLYEIGKPCLQDGIFALRNAIIDDLRDASPRSGVRLPPEETLPDVGPPAREPQGPSAALRVKGQVVAVDPGQTAARFRRVPLPTSPMLSLPGEIPVGAGWSFEVKWDGFRALVSTENGLQGAKPRGWNMTPACRSSRVARGLVARRRARRVQRRRRPALPAPLQPDVSRRTRHPRGADGASTCSRSRANRF